MKKYTFLKKYRAWNKSKSDLVLIPDQVYENQRMYDGRTFPILKRRNFFSDFDIKGRGQLLGDEYGLNTPGTGDPVVSILS